jgi:hypothetical protein
MNTNIANGKTWQEWTLRTSSGEIRQACMASALKQCDEHHQLRSGTAGHLHLRADSLQATVIAEQSGAVAATSLCTYTHT